MSENTRIALISASAAIVGALAGGLATYITTQQSEKAQDQREERRVDDEAAGVARRMIVEFRQAVFLSQSLATRGARTPRALVFAGRVGFPLEASAEELGLLYSRLRRREFKAVADGLNIADLIGAELREPVEKAALPGVKQDAATWIEYLVDAREALRRVARTGSELHR